MDLIIMLALLLAQAPAHMFFGDQHAFRVPSSFLEPPPFSRTYKASQPSNTKVLPIMQPLHAKAVPIVQPLHAKPLPIVQPLHAKPLPTVQPLQAKPLPIVQPPHTKSLTIVQPPHTNTLPVVQRTTRQQNSKLIQSKEFWQPKHIAPVESQLLPTQHDYSSYYDLKCNPCNHGPWIPVIGYVYPNGATQQPSHPVNIPFNPYYLPINDLSSNLVNQASVSPPSFPLYVGPPLYQQYSPHTHHNSLWPTVNLPNASPISVPEMHPVQETVHENPLATSYSTAEPPLSSAVNVAGLGLSNWINEAKPVPVFHYEHDIDYPTQYVHSPALDIPHQIPQAHPIPPLAPYPSALEGAIFSTPSSDSLIDISNHLEDSKYSSSEDKFSFSRNNTDKDSKGLRVYRVGASRNVSDIIEYLTPPPSAISGHGWMETPLPHTDKKAHLKPLEDWAFIKEVEPKSEKRKKQIQIVIPYTTNKSKHTPKTLKENPSSSSSSSTTKWYLTTNTTTTMLPLINYLRGNPGAGTKSRPTSSEPTDWQKLRKAIDSWTEERFSNHKYNSSIHFDMGLSTLPPSKEIPKDFFRSSPVYRENKKEKFTIDYMQNRVSSGIKGRGSSSTTTTQRNYPSYSGSTSKEKVYIVTPLPLTNYSFSSNGIDSENWTFL